MKDYQKNYIECRFIILGDYNVGKKSFISRLLTAPSTTVLHNKYAEEESLKKLSKIIEDNKSLSQENYNSYLSNQKIIEDQTSSLSRSKEKIKYKTIDEDTKNFSKTGMPGKIFKNNLNNSINNNKHNQMEFLMKFLPTKPSFSRRYQRPCLIEYPSKLFNINKTKIVLKPYNIFPPENVPADYQIPEDDENDFITDEKKRYAIKGFRNDIEQILSDKKKIIDEEKLIGYNVYAHNFFLFMYDMSNFKSFEKMMFFFNTLEKIFVFDSDENEFIFNIIANKKDKIISTLSQKDTQDQIENFSKEKNLKKYEISTKPFFNFDKFLYDFLVDELSAVHPDIFSEYNFKNELEKILLKKSNFSRAAREIYDPTLNFPGPGYDLNIYGYSTMKELNEAFTNKKTRFTKKIFSNKQGPIFCKSKSAKDILNSKEENHEKYIPPVTSKGGVLNKPPVGYSFGLINGKLELMKSRKENILERNQSIRDSLEDDCSLYKASPKFKIKDENYFKKVQINKKKEFTTRNEKFKEKSEKFLQINKSNLENLKEEQENKKNNLIEKLKLMKSSSSPNFLRSSLTEEDENEFEKALNRERFCNIIFPKHKNYVEKFEKRRKLIIQNKQYSDTPGPNAYDIRGNIYDPKKGPYILGKRKDIIFTKIDPSFPDYKDEFEVLVEKAEKSPKKRFFRPRFRDIIREKDPGPYPDQKIWEKWEKNKLSNENTKILRKFFDYRKQKKDDSIENLKKIEEINEEMKEIRRNNLIKKGYEDPAIIKNINYSLVEEASPKYTIKGKRRQRNYSNEDFGYIMLGDNENMLEIIKNEQLNRPLPDLNVVKPKLPSIIFTKAERFHKEKSEPENITFLFKDGVFAPKTQEDFFKKEPFSRTAKRSFMCVDKKDDSPSPAEYKIKSTFEKIAENGKKISEVHKKIREKMEMEKKIDYATRNGSKIIIELNNNGNDNMNEGKNKGEGNNGEIILKLDEN